MNKLTRRERPNIRFSCKFYTYAKTNNAEPETNEYGELEQEFSLHCVGLMAKEKPLKPQEAVEGDRAISEQTFILIGNWTYTLAKVTHGMFCFIPQQGLYAVNGNATDPWGDRKKIHIYVVDNVTQDIRQKIPGAML